MILDERVAMKVCCNMLAVCDWKEEQNEEGFCCAGISEAILILTKQSSADVERITAGSGAADLASCDLGVFLFDSSSLHSMTEALQLLLSVTSAANNSLPCVMLAAKDDLGMSQVQRHPKIISVS